MFIYLDESGDLGFNFSKSGTSKFFMITLLVCKTREMQFLARNAAKRTLRQVNHKRKKPLSELKGNNTTLRVKKYFIRNLKMTDEYCIYSVILDKRRLQSKGGRIDQHRVYVKLSQLILDKIKIDKNVQWIQVIADKCKRGIQEKDFAFSLRSVLEKNVPFAVNIAIEQIPSLNDFGLQAVDMFSSGLFHRYEHKNNEWYDLFAERIKLEILVDN